MAGRDSARVETLTRQIASHAQSKQLSSALEAYEAIWREGLAPTKYTYSALVNAHVTSGDLCGAAGAVAQMKAAGFAPNLIVLTTLLKGHCAVGDLPAAQALLESMSEQTPPLRPDARTLNTYLRGCVRVGDLGAARWAYAQLPRWQLVPAAPSKIAFSRLLSQGLRLSQLRRLLAEHSRLASAPVEHRPTRTANRCSFWERGRCERALQCKFYHDPSIPQADAAAVAAANRDVEAELCVHLAHAAALLGRDAACRHAVRRARELLESAAEAAHLHPDERELAAFRRAELARDTERLRAHVTRRAAERAAEGVVAPMRLGRYLQR